MSNLPIDKREHGYYIIVMHSTESVIIKVAQPNKRKANWLNAMADNFGQAVQLGLNAAKAEGTSNRGEIHKAVYYQARQQCGLPGDYARMAIGAAMSLMRCHYGLRKSSKHTGFPTVKSMHNIGLGVASYKIVLSNERFALRVSTGDRGQYIWLPLCVPSRYRESVIHATNKANHHDAKLFKRHGQWYVMLPVRIPALPTKCFGEHSFIGIDLGIVRHATIVTPDRTVFFDGKAARHNREHHADLRRRYQAHRRTDRVRDQGDKEHRWMSDLNHKLSRQIVNLAAQYPNPVIVLERLDGIRYRVHGSKRFNRMMAGWAFRDLVDKIKYKAQRLAILVVFVDPRKTSQTCSKCGFVSRSNRPDQSTFRCVACSYRTNADRNAACNIAALGPGALTQEPPDTARPGEGQTEDIGSRLDGVKELASVRSDPNFASSTLEPRV